MEKFEIAPGALDQIARIESICISLGRRVDNIIPQVFPEDLINLQRLAKIIQRLPNVSPGQDITLSIFDGANPRQSYKRLQFGERVIELGELQVCINDSNEFEWAGVTYFGAFIGLPSGCQSETHQSDLEDWITQIDRQCSESTLIWRVQVGQTLGHQLWPTHLESE